MVATISSEVNRDPERQETEAMDATLKAKLISLVELSKTNPNAVEYLYTILERTADRFERQQVKLAISHAQRNQK
jgi:hypothetical protein